MFKFKKLESESFDTFLKNEITERSKLIIKLFED